MAYAGRVQSGLGAERPLEDEEVEHFINTVGWPFIGTLAGYDFLEESELSESIQHTLVDRNEPKNAKTLRLKVEAIHTNNDVILSAGQSAIKATIEAQTLQPDLTAVMYDRYFEALVADQSRLFEDLVLAPDVQAWRIEQLSFKNVFRTRTNDFECWNAAYALRYELHTKKVPAEVILTDSVFFDGSGASTNSTLGEVASLDEKINEFSIYNSDLQSIHRAIARVGFKGISYPKAIKAKSKK